MIDQVIVLIYLFVVLLIGLMSGKNTSNLEDYAIGKRNFSNSVLTAGIAATMIAASGTAGLVGKIYHTGLICALSYFGIVISRMIVAFVIAPKMSKFLGLISSGDILEKLYGSKAKILIGLFTLVEGSLLSAAQILATYQAGQILFGLTKESSAIITTAIIVAYCFRGGIRSVNATDVFQFAIMIIAMPIVAFIAIEKIGGVPIFITTLNEKKLLFDSFINGDYLKHLAIFASLALTCVFPLTIQRMLMAKNHEQIKTTFFINSLITIFFYTALSVIGLAAPILLANIDSNFALPIIIHEILPVGIKGLVIAGLIAIFMSSADSDMNISAIALTQDFLKPILKDKLTDKMAFLITRSSFLFIGFFATIVALYYSNALDILFLVMTISNSVYFPGLFLGILGFKPSPRSFWFGAFAGALTAIIMCIGYKIFSLYAMMTAIMINSLFLFASCFKSWIRNNKNFSLNFIPYGENNFFEFKKSSFQITSNSYCDIFSIFVISKSLLIFFWLGISINLPLYLVVSYLMASVLSLVLILREFFKIKKTFFIIWQTTVFLSLISANIFTLSQLDFSLYLFLNLISSFLLMTFLINKKEIFFQLISSLIVVLILNNTIKTNFFNFDEMHKLCIIIEMIALIIFAALFRKRDVDAYKFVALKLAHETGRTMSSVSLAANILDNYLPILVGEYKRNHHQNEKNSALKKDDLDYLINLPKNLFSSSNKTWQNINNITDWIRANKKNENFKSYSIKTALEAALSDSSLPKNIKDILVIKDFENFLFHGDNAQITHVILNILENAYHAISDNPNGKIIIFTKENSLHIKDTGVGISKKDLPNIFDDFFSTKGTSGQGLAFCKMVLDQHNAQISCESKKGEYTEFKITFSKISRENI